MDQRTTIDHSSIDAVYADAAQVVHLNLGEQTIHAKRMPGAWRRLKWLASSVWLIYFFGPYLRLDGRQAVLFDIPNRQFHLFGATVLPQDFWMLSMALLFFALLLAVVTAMAGRIYCGFFCFQTVWTDLYTLIEERLEGNPAQRRKLDKAPWNGHKLLIKSGKHLLWLLIAIFTGISFVAWFTDAHQLWLDLFALNASSVAVSTIALFTVGTYFLAGFMREQVCLWLCPYARIQSAMVDKHTVIPTYDFTRGEPRGNLRKQQAAAGDRHGDCIDCNLCVAVCPTGVDIRNGLQEGCLMCGLCLDACDDVMDKVMRPRGLIRFASLDEMEGAPAIPLLKRTRVWVYSSIMLLALSGIIYGFSALEAIELKVLHGRQPLYVLQSDGSIQNRYTLKILNKSNQDTQLVISASGPSGLALKGAEHPITARKGQPTAATVFVRVPRQNLKGELEPILFQVEAVGEQAISAERESIFIGPGS